MDIMNIDYGQWCMLAFYTACMNNSSFAFAASAQVDNNVFLRDYHGITDEVFILPA